ncbi:sensor histidine kinase [Chitinophaga defluvii]|uniref:Histidine kinase n=1 Tax=Chitinophaga defluvii TaxID=3163343 RepID=A0ABV2TD79_9BACT
MLAKKAIKDTLGFDDTRLMIVGIPLVAFLSPIIYLHFRFWKAPYYPADAFFWCLLFTTLFWFGNRWVLILFRKKFPAFSQSRKRIFITAMVMFGYNLFLSNILEITAPPHEYRPVLHFDAIDTNLMSIMNTLIIVVIYEVIYYMGQFRISVHEQEKLKQESLLAQIAALKNQVDPHFLFNNLNTLSAIVRDDPAQAEAFIQQLSKLYRYILEMPESTLVDLRAELDLLSAYTFLLKTRFGDNFHINITIPTHYLEKKIVPFALQILIENAIKHNVASTAKPLTINIGVQDDKIVVSNNLQKKQTHIPSTKMGLRNISIRSRLLQNQDIQYITTTDQFIVTVPLIPAAI